MGRIEWEYFYRFNDFLWSLFPTEEQSLFLLSESSLPFKKFGPRFALRFNVSSHGLLAPASPRAVFGNLVEALRTKKSFYGTKIRTFFVMFTTRNEIQECCYCIWIYSTKKIISLSYFI